MIAPMPDEYLAAPGPPAGPATAPRPLDTSDDTKDTAGATASGAARPGGGGARWLPRIVIAGIVLAALNLRPAITSLGALLEEVRDGLGMSGTVAGLLTSVPSLCFAVFGIA